MCRRVADRRDSIVTGNILPVCLSDDWTAPLL